MTEPAPDRAAPAPSTTTPPAAPATPPLLDKLPPAGTTDQDVILNAFLDAVGDKGLSLYPAQEESILELLAGKNVVLSTPTGSGKSLVATALHFKAMSEGKVSVYTAPIKALVSEKFFALCREFGAPYVGMMTGDATINRDAPILCCTAEILANLALRDGDAARVDAVIMDEFHYYGDKERGMAWQVPLLLLPKVQFLLMSATLGDMSGIMRAMKERSGRPVVEVTGAERPVPLDFEYKEIPVHETIEELVKSGRAPVYVVHFTQREAAEQAQALTSATFFTKEDKAKIAEAIRGFRFDTPYGREFSRFIKAGIGLHHAGLLPRYRLLVENLAQTGALKVICGTDTLGVGVNIPIRTVLFTKLAKFDGEKTGVLSARDFKQIAGRAGRKGFDDRGSVVCQAPEHVIENKRAEAKYADGSSKKKPQKKQPEQGFVGWDQNTFQRLIDKPPEALSSRFQITHGVLMALLQSGQEADADVVVAPLLPAPAKAAVDGESDAAAPEPELPIDHPGFRRLEQMIALSHESDTNKEKHRRHARVLYRSLVDAGLVTVGADGSVVVNAALQNDFSLNQSLSLYLVETLFLIDPARETYALDVMTVVESVLENPKMILLKQEDQAKTLKMAEMKQNGVEYEERMAELEKITWPKPLADFIYDTFNAFEAKHPWVGHENIRPKSIARDMIERYASFHEYIKEYGLERSEGLLLRYLSDFYKTLVQTVPEARKDERLLDVQGYFRALLARVDASLVEEWESLANPDVKADKPLLGPPQPVDITKDKKSFAARVRAEMHAVVRALSRGDFEDALLGLKPSEPPWTPERLKAELQPFLDEHGAVSFLPLARQPKLTIVDEEAPRRFRVRQILIDDQDENDWALEGEIDLTDRKGTAEPLVELRRIGR